MSSEDFGGDIETYLDSAVTVVVQNGGDVNITSLKKIDGVENQTLIRGEVGGSFNFRNGWSGFGAVAYAVGDDYNSTDFNMGVNYSW